MLDSTAIKARIETNVPELAGRTGEAAELAAQMMRNSPPNVTPAAYVVPADLRGGKGSAMAGMFVQSVTETVSVVLFVSGHDATGRRALSQVRPIMDAIIGAVAGWAPDGRGVFELKLARRVSFDNATLIYQIDFAINDQLRIAS